LRFIQAAPSLNVPADVYVTAPATDITNVSPTVSGVNFRGVTAYLALPSATYRVRVTASGSKQPLIDVSNVGVNDGSIATLLSLDKTGGGTPLQLLKLIDN